MRNAPRAALAAGVAAAALAGTAGSALAAAPTGVWAQFAQCPTAAVIGASIDPSEAACVRSVATSGSFTLGNINVPVTRAIVFQGGNATIDAQGDTAYSDALNGKDLSNSPQTIPGGLSALTPPPADVPPPLSTILSKAIAKNNTVTGTAVLVGTPQVSFANYADESGPALVLPVEIKLSNPFLGPNCYVGSSDDPITLNLTTGTTDPPTGVMPLTGSPGTVVFSHGSALIVAGPNSLVDNTFPVPAATTCGNPAYGATLDAAITAGINAFVGLPSAAGDSSATLDGVTKQAAAEAVAASEGGSSSAHR